MAQRLGLTNQMSEHELEVKVSSVSEKIQLLTAVRLLPAVTRCCEVYQIMGVDRDQLDRLHHNLQRLQRGQKAGEAMDIRALSADLVRAVHNLSMDDLRFFEAFLLCQALVMFLRQQPDLTARIATITAIMQGNTYAQGVLNGLEVCRMLLAPLVAGRLSFRQLCTHIREVAARGHENMLKILRAGQANLATLTMWMADTSGASMESVLRKVGELFSCDL